MPIGDGQTTVQAVGKPLGIDEVIADMPPKNKSAGSAELGSVNRRQGCDGGYHAAWPLPRSASRWVPARTWRWSSGINLLNGHLMGIVRARRVSLATMLNIRQNLFSTFVYNLDATPLPSSIIAAPAMALSCVSVVANSRQLRCTMAQGGSGGRRHRGRPS